MTTERTFSGANRDVQDHWEMQLWGEVTYDAPGAYMRVRGNDTQEYEMGVLNTGVGMNLGKDYNAEVAPMGFGSDPNNKMVWQLIPRDKQRPWKEKTSGLQYALDKDRALEFNEKRAWLEDVAIALHRLGLFEIKDGEILIRCNVKIDPAYQIYATGSGAVAVPAFDP